MVRNASPFPAGRNCDRAAEPNFGGRFLVAAVGLLLFAAEEPALAPAAQRDVYRQARLDMVSDYIEREGISSTRVLDAMRQVPRHEFVDARMRPKAYQDAALPIGFKQTISPPFVVAYMTEIVDPQPTDRVLEIGTGSGYQAAVLSGLVQEVYTIEIVGPLGRKAAARLKRLRYDNVNVKVGDGYEGWPEHAPFDKIIVTCSPAEVPEPLVEQLKEGGKMIIPLGQRYQQVFHLLEKRDGELHETRLISTFFVPMTGMSEEQRKAEPDGARPQLVNGSFEVDANEDGRADGWHYQRQTTLVPVEAPHGERYVRMHNTDPGRDAQMLQGFPVDGRRVAALKFDLLIRYDQTVAGPESYQTPSLVVHLYDAQRRPVGDVQHGSWLGSDDWKRVSYDVVVPVKVREAVVRVGLIGATGTLSIDQIDLTPTPR